MSHSLLADQTQEAVDGKRVILSIPPLAAYDAVVASHTVETDCKVSVHMILDSRLVAADVLL